MDGNILTAAMIENPIQSVVQSLPGAVVVCDMVGRIVCSNECAQRLLQISAGKRSVAELFTRPERLNSALFEARRSNGGWPLRLTHALSGQTLRATIKTVMAAPAKRSPFMLVSFEDHNEATRHWRVLNEQLRSALREQQNLRRENRSLRDTVSLTLPKLKQQSYRDPLTKCNNRRYFDRQLKREWQRATRQGGALSLLFIDIDHFKEYNDTLGHPQGDQCLVQVAKALRDAASRGFDCVCRYGGEEFAVILPMTGESGASLVAEKVLKAVRDQAIVHPNNVVDIVTISIGVGTCRPGPADELSWFLQSVDSAMYEAKQAGRNGFVQLRSDKAVVASGSTGVDIGNVQRSSGEYPVTEHESGENGDTADGHVYHHEA